MRSGLSGNGKRPITASSGTNVDETYDLEGIDLRNPDEIMAAGASPWTINSRMYATDYSDTSVAISTRMGASHLSSPISSGTNVANLTTGTSDLDFSVTKGVAFPITFTSVGAVSRIDIELKKTSTTTGHVLIELYTNSSGLPGTLLAQGSILASTITTTYQLLKCYFIDAPTVAIGTQYWAVAYIQDNGSGSYYLHQTPQVSGTSSVIYSVNDGVTWTPTVSSVRYQSYLASAGGVKGYAMRYPSDASTYRIMVAQLGNLYQIPKSTGTPALVDSTMTASAPYVRFEQVYDFTLYVNGFDTLKQWDGTNTPTTVTNVPAEVQYPDNVILWQNRIFIYKGTRVVFSDLLTTSLANVTWSSTNYFYIPISSPKSPDHISGWRIFNNNLVVFTHLTKFQVIGSNISNFTYKEVVGTKGAVSHEAMAVDSNYIYFMSDDKQIWRWNGVSDEKLSIKVQRELNTISDVTKVRFHLYNNQLRIYYPKAPSATSNRMLLLDLDNSRPNDFQWFLDTDRPVCGSTAMYLDKNELIEFSSLVGRVYYGETVGSDLGKALDFKWWSNYKTYKARNGAGGASTKKRIKRFRPIIRTEDADYTMLIGKDMDFNNTPDMREYLVSGGGATFGSFRWGDGTKWGKDKQVMNQAGMSGRGNFIQYRFERKGVETPVELYGYVSQYKIGKPK